jgi:hypothetical protein
VRAQQGERMRRIGVLMHTAADEPESQARLAALDPVGNGYVDSLARPGGNITGFIQFEYALAGKWAELLKEVAPAKLGMLYLWEGEGQYRVAALLTSSPGLIPRRPSSSSRP